MREKNKLYKQIIENRLTTLIIISIIIILMLSILKPGTFLNYSNFSGIFTTMSFDLLLSCGMTIVLIVGGVDLSVGAVVALASIISAVLTKRGMGVFFTIIITILVGAIVGIINGILVTKFKLAPFVATLGIQSIIRGFCYVTTSGYLISGLSPAFTNLSRATIVFIPSLVLISVILSIIVGILLKKMNLFKQMYMIGTSPKSAEMSGIPADKLKVFAYMLSGFFAGLSGVLIASRYGMGAATYGIGFESRAIAASVIGGAVMSGGEGDMLVQCLVC